MKEDMFLNSWNFSTTCNVNQAVFLRTRARAQCSLKRGSTVLLGTVLEYDLAEFVSAMLEGYRFTPCR